MRAALGASFADLATASSLEDVVSARRAGGRDVLVADLRRAAESGAELVRRLRLALPSARVLCLLAPGLAPPADVDAFLTAPFYLADVVRWCARAREAPPEEAVLADMATGIRHEIGNPLTALLLQLELMKAEGGLNGLKEQIDLIEDSGRRIQHVLEDVTAASERRPVNAAPLALGDLLETARQALAALEPERVDRLVLPEPPGAGPQIDVDGELLAHALADLWRYLLLADDDREPVYVEAEAAGATVTLRSRCRAARLPDDAALRLFTPLWARQALGLTDGLSLSAARGTLLRHGGDLRARQEPSGWLRVDAILPRAPGPSSTLRPSPPSSTTARGPQETKKRPSPP